MKTFSIKEAYKKAWELWKQHKALMTFTAIVSLVLGGFRSGEHGYYFYSPMMIVLTIAFIVLSILIKIGLTKLFLKVTDGQPTDWKEIFKHRELFFVYLGTSILYGLGIVVGTILLVIPGLYFVFTYMFAPVLVIDKNIGIKEAFKRSAEMTKGVKWSLLWLMLVLVATNLAGAFVFMVGLLISIPVTSLVYMQVYRKLSN
jgi:uncharacterized membrane protein